MKKRTPLTIYPAEKGLRKVLTDYQEEALRALWAENRPMSSKEVWQKVNDVIEGTISRASIINFLNDMVDEGVLNYREETGKGGYRRIYTPKMNEGDFKKHVIRTMIQSLLKDFPKETYEAITELK